MIRNLLFIIGLLMTAPAPRRPGRRTQADVDAPNVVTLSQAFKEAGYTTISNGKVFHPRGDTEDRSWSEPDWRPEGGCALSIDPPRGCGSRLIRRAIRRRSPRLRGRT